MLNRLAAESSPYLLQHRNNPVDWYPWGPEALTRSKTEQKPIFLSIGYSACHWCHVMEHESFENPRIARLMNEHFVCIKVDREERPDLDQIYMNAVQILTGRGGWPMSVFLTPQLEPFYGGTYWPDSPRGGMPGFDQVLAAVESAWRERREQVTQQAAELTQYLRGGTIRESGDTLLSDELLRNAAAAIQRSFDPQHGGFGGAPKFPHPMDLRLLLRAWRRWRSPAALEAVTVTLNKMAAGGIYDQLGGGFHRYSVDERWLVPHFEKMLYDNALLSGAYLDAFLATGVADFARVVRETLDYLLRDMTDPVGGIYSTEDADSEGEEGKFYVWTPDEIEAVVGSEAAQVFCYVYDVSDQGNFEQVNILNLPKSIDQSAQLRDWKADELRQRLAEWRKQLFDAREKRVRPALDDKVLVSWNGLAIDALAQAGAALGDLRYTAAATKAAEFILSQMRRPDGRLLHTWRRHENSAPGTARLDAYLDDYAALIGGLVSLYEATFDERLIDEAVSLADAMLEHFEDPADGGFFFTANDHEKLVARQKEWHDGATPSGNALAATALLRLAKLTGRADFLTAAEKTLRAAAGLMGRYPIAAGQMLAALDFYLGPTPEIVLLAETSSDLTATLADLRRRFIPNRVVAACVCAGGENHSAALATIFAGKTPQQPPPTAYICENFSCQAPISGHDAVVAAWHRLAET